MKDHQPEWEPMWYSGRCSECGVRCGPMTGSAGWQTVVSRICPSGRRLDTFVKLCDACLDRHHAARRAAEEAKHHRSPGSDPFMRAFFVFVLICVIAGIAVYFIASLQSAAR